MSSLLEELWGSCQDYISKLPPDEARQLAINIPSQPTQNASELFWHSSNTTTNPSDYTFHTLTSGGSQALKITPWHQGSVNSSTSATKRSCKEKLCQTKTNDKVPRRRSQRVRNQLARRLGESLPSANESVNVVLSQSIFDPGAMEREAKTDPESELIKDNGQGSTGNLKDDQKEDASASADMSGSLQESECEKSTDDSTSESSTSEPNSSMSDDQNTKPCIGNVHVPSEASDPNVERMCKANTCDDVAFDATGNNGQSVDEDSMSDTTQSDGSGSEEESEQSSSAYTSTSSSTPDQSSTPSPTPNESTTPSPSPIESSTPSPNSEECANTEDSTGFCTANSSVTGSDSFITPGLEPSHAETTGPAQSHSEASETAMDAENDGSDVSLSNSEVESADIIAALSQELSSLNKDSEHFTTPLHKSKCAKVRTPHRTPAKIRFNFKTPTKSPGVASHGESVKFSGSPLGQFGFKTPPRSSQLKQSQQEYNWKGIKRKESFDDGVTEDRKSKKRYEKDDEDHYLVYILSKISCFK